jgi:hypothetical protein
VAARGELARRLDATAVTLTAGRDLFAVQNRFARLAGFLVGRRSF